MAVRAEAVRALGQDFRAVVGDVVAGVMVHLREDNASDLLGPSLASLVSRASLKAIVTFALYADVLRVVRDVLLADGEISDDEVREALPILATLAAGFAGVRKEYAGYAALRAENAREFLDRYGADAKAFGHADEATKWAGVELCRNVQVRCRDEKPLGRLGNALVEWAESLAASDRLPAIDQEYIATIRNREGLSTAQPGKPAVLTRCIAERIIHDACERPTMEFTSLDEGAADILSQAGSLDLSGLSCLAPVDAVALARCKGSLDLSGLLAGSDDLVEALARHGGDGGRLLLNGIPALSTQAAVFLSQHKGGLCLNGVLTISDEVAEALARSEGGLDLNGLTQLSDAAAKCLRKHKGYLHLDGLSVLSDKAAKALARHREGLSLNAVATLSDEAAKALAQHDGSLSLNGLTTLSDEAAKALAQHEGWLSLDGLTTLSDEAAKALAQHTGGLSLDGLTTLSDEAAKALAQHTGGLFLNGLTTLSDEAAKALAQHDGSLSLNGLTTLSDEAAKALAQQEVFLSLNGLTTLSDEAANALAQCDGALSLNGLTTLSDEAAKALAQREVFLFLDGLTTLSDEAANALAQCDGGLSLNGLTTLSDEAAKALAQHDGSLSLNGLTTLSDEAAKALAERAGKALDSDNLTVLTSPSLARGLSRKAGDSLSFDAVTSISVEAARAVAEHNGEVSLGGLKTITEAVAEAFSRHQGTLSLNGLSELSVGAANALARHKGRLKLLGLATLCDDAARSLCPAVASMIICPEMRERLEASRQHFTDSLGRLRTLTDDHLAMLACYRGDVSLDSLESLSEEAARILVNRRGSLSLNGLASLSDDVANVLAGYADQLSMAGLTSLSDAAARLLATVTVEIPTTHWPESAVAAYTTEREHLKAMLSFVENPGAIDLSAFSELSAAQARTLARSGWYLNLSGLAAVSDEVAAILGGHAGTLNLAGLELISEAGASALGRHEGPLLVTAERLRTPVFVAIMNAKRSLYPEPPGTVTNSLGMKFVPIPAGSFVMGTPGDEGEEFQHEVRITRPFLLGMHAVTQWQYTRVMGENPSHFEGSDLPVEHLAWTDAKAFCESLSALPDEQNAGRTYRLPTEAEWEYACRCGTTTPFNTGHSLDPGTARFSSEEMWEPQQTVPVGSYAPNAWGLFDMHGNVWEWTRDWFSADYFRQSPIDDPQGPETGTHHVFRGGSASVTAGECRSAMRGEASSVDGPTDQPVETFEKLGDFGVRVVCESGRC